MNEFVRSICSTCIHRTYCSLSEQRAYTNLCNEYQHYLEDTDLPTIVISDEMN
ncbi:hypothetical protein GGE08_001906 [Muricauda sp. ARW1Y1]|jgi:hypothetical protein|nr:hypothetical protein [Muricauda sp. ARW1Y1]